MKHFRLDHPFGNNLSRGGFRGNEGTERLHPFKNWDAKIRENSVKNKKQSA